MLINLCLHSHNFFCDGSSHPEKYIQSAIYKGFTQYGFSSHAPLKFPIKWAMKFDKLVEYSNLIDELKEKYKDQIDIFKSLEIDYVPDDSYSFEYFKEKIGLDYTVGSIHLVKNPTNGNIWFIDGPQAGFDKGIQEVFGGDIKTAVTQYFQQSIDMMKLHKPDIIGHLDKVVMNNANRHFKIDEDWYLKALKKLLVCAKEHNTIVEINTRGLYQQRWTDTYPGKYIWPMILELEIPIVMNSDAHKPEEIDGLYDETRQSLKDFGFTHQMMRKADKWIETDI